MRVFLWCLFGFGLGLVTGYAAIYFGWIAYSQQFHVADGYGSKILDVEFIWAPAGAVVMGFYLAFRLALGAARRTVAKRRR
jgi:energy-coupling factor transporter transmembrane protein EcfT